MKKISKAILSIVFCVSLVLSTMLPAFAALAQTKSIKVSAVTPTSVTLKWSKVSGATGYDIEQYSAKKWKKVATSSKTSYTVKKLTVGTSYKFRVRALKKSGKSVTYGKYSQTVTAKPAPAQVKNVKLSASTATSATIKWSKVSGASGYRVQQLVDKKWVTVVKSTTKTSATVSSLAPGSKTSLRVCAFQKIKSKTYYGAYSSTLSVKTPKLSAPKSPTSSSITESSVKISWKKVSQATSYVVYSIKGSTQSEVGKTTKTNLTVKNLSAATDYCFSVRACATINSKNYKSSFSDNLSVKTSPAKAAKPTAKPSDNEVTLSWKASTGADGYEIYRYNAKTSAWDYIGSALTNTYKVINLSSLTDYEFKIRAYHTATAQKVYGAFSDSVKVTTLAGAVSGLAVAGITDTSVTVSWTTVAKAEGYKVEISSDGKNWTAVTEKQTTANGKTSVSAKSLKASTDYIIRVSIIIGGNAGVPTEIALRTAPAKVTGLIANDLRKSTDSFNGQPMKKINLSWKNTSGATGYEISMCDSSKNWQVIGATAGTGFSVNNLNDDVEYSFRIRAYYTLNKTNYYGPYSDIAIAKELPADVTGIAVSQIGKNAATVSWDVHAKAEKYNVRLKENNGEYSIINVTPVTQNGKVSVLINSLKPGYSYSVSICAVVGNDESYPMECFFKTFPGKTESFVATDTSDTSVTLAWDPVTGAEGYEIEKLNTDTNQYEKVQTTVTMSAIIGNLIPSRVYKFRVRAYNTTGGRTQYGDYSEILSATTINAAITNLTVSNITTSSVTLTWDIVAGSKYEVEMSKNGAAYTSAGTPTVENGKAKLVLNSLDSATKYDFKIRSVNGTVFGAWTTTSAKTAPTAPTSFVATATSDSTISISWTAPRGADGYVISMKKSGGSWTELSPTTTDYYELTGLVASTEYSFKVKAYTMLNGDKNYSAFTNEVSATTQATAVAVTGFTATAKSSSSIELSWNVISGASYIIEMSENNGSTYKSVSGTPSVSGGKQVLTVTNLKSGTTYIFRIRATVAGQPGNYSSATATTTGASSTGTVSGLTASSKASGSSVSITLSWTAYQGASYYLVKCDNPTISQKVTNTSYVVSSGITSGKSYTFYIEAYNSSNVLIAKSAGKSCTAATASASTKPIENIKVELDEDGKSYSIAWKDISNALYFVERWDSATSSWVQISSSKYSNPAWINVNDDSIRVSSSKKTDFTTSVSWQGVSGAKSYKISSKISSDSLKNYWKTEATSSTTSTELRLPPESKQTIRVTAVSNVKLRIRAVNAANESEEIASKEFNTDIYSAYGDITFTTPRVAFNSSSTDSKEAYTLMLVQAINNTKLEASKVTSKVNKDFDAVLDSNSFKVVDPLGEHSISWVLERFPELKTELESLTDGMSEKSETTCEFTNGFGKGKTIKENSDGTTTVNENQGVFLEKFIEPSVDSSKRSEYYAVSPNFAYLYDQHNINSFNKGIDSVEVVSLPNNGYKISVKLKSETATAKTDAKYHKGFMDNFVIDSSSLSKFSDDEIDVEATGTVKNTVITAVINKDYKLDSLDVSGNFLIDVVATKNVLFVKLGVKADINGKTDIKYTFTR